MRYDQMKLLRDALRALPGRTPPEELTKQLRIMASLAIEKRLRRATLWHLLARRVDDARLLFDNLMRPVAVPVAGGLVSALVLFSVLAPSFAIQRVQGDDVPTALYTQATLQSAISFSLGDEDIIVDVLIDDQGRVVDYSVPRGQKWTSDPSLVRGLENTLLLTRFAPATWFGQPAAGKTRITLRRSILDVRG